MISFPPPHPPGTELVGEGGLIPLGTSGIWSQAFWSSRCTSIKLFYIGPQELLTLRMMRQCEEANTGCTDARAKDSDSTGISSKEGNILTHPAEGLDLVKEPIVALSSLIPSAQET